MRYRIESASSLKTQDAALENWAKDAFWSGSATIAASSGRHDRGQTSVVGTQRTAHGCGLHGGRLLLSEGRHRKAARPSADSEREEERAVGIEPA